MGLVGKVKESRELGGAGAQGGTQASSKGGVLLLRSSLLLPCEPAAPMSSDLPIFQEKQEIWIFVCEIC